MLAGAALLLTVGAAPLWAQFKGFPAYPIAAARPAWVVVADLGSGLNPASGRGHHLGGRVAGNLGPLSIAAGGGAWDAATGTSLQLGGTFGARVLGPAAGALALFAVAGAGTARAGPSDSAATYWTFPLGLAVVRPSRGGGAGVVTPWLFPRLQIDRVTFAAARATQLGAGLAAGVSAEVTARLGVHGALEWLHQFRWAGSVLTLEGGERVTMGLGAYWRVSSAP